MEENTHNSDGAAKSEAELEKWWHGAIFEWDWSKQPADPACRAEWAETLREEREFIFQQTAPGSKGRRDFLAKARALYYEIKPRIIEAEVPIREAVEKLRHDFVIWKIRRALAARKAALLDSQTEGGIQ